jgi:cytochrome c oxidase subunit 3
MATTLASPKSVRSFAGGGSGHDDHGSHGGSGGHGSGARGRELPARVYRTGMWMGLAAIVMLFAAFTSAMVVREGISSDWVSTRLPGIIYLNTILLLGSSLTLELSRRSLAREAAKQFVLWLCLTLGLGLGFVAGQLQAWRELAARGVYLATNPSSSFFYVLTAAHAIHLLGGIAALSYLVLRARRLLLDPRRRTSVEVTAIYWHFMDALWVYILFLLMARL